MKLKQLFLAIFATSVLFVSCSKDDVYEPVKPTSTVTSEPTSTATSESSNMRVMSTPATVNATVNKAYIFIEPNTKSKIIKDYLLSLPRTSTNPITFTGFFGVNAGSWIRTFQNYVDMPYWNNGVLPAIIESDIPQTNGGPDSFGNPVVAYNFKTVKISKNTINSLAWVNILIPVNAMNGDTKRQRTVNHYEITKKNNKDVTVLNLNRNMDNVVYSTIINYQGNRIPKGLYRLYSTYPGTGLRITFNTTNDVYLRGFSN
jgi:hypothetical protein